MSKVIPEIQQRPLCFSCPLFHKQPYRGFAIADAPPVTAATLPASLPICHILENIDYLRLAGARPTDQGCTSSVGNSAGIQISIT